MVATSKIRQYLKQLQQLGASELIFSPEFNAGEICKPRISQPVHQIGGAKHQATPSRQNAPPPKSASQKILSKIKPVDQLLYTAPVENVISKREKLLGLYHEAKNCRACALCKSRSKIVFGSGNIDGALMVIGDAPLKGDEKRGIPFSGTTGKLLEKMLKAIDIDRTKDAFVTTVVKCCVEEELTAECNEVVSCYHILQQQAQIMNPKAFLVMGRLASTVLLKSDQNIDLLRKSQHSFMGRPVVVTYSPLFLSSEHNNNFKYDAWDDLKKLKRVLES